MEVSRTGVSRSFRSQVLRVNQLNVQSFNWLDPIGLIVPSPRIYVLVQSNPESTNDSMEGGVYSDTDTICLKPIHEWGTVDPLRWRDQDSIDGTPSMIIGVEADVGDRDDWHDVSSFVLSSSSLSKEKEREVTSIEGI